MQGLSEVADVLLQRGQYKKLVIAHRKIYILFKASNQELGYPDKCTL